MLETGIIFIAIILLFFVLSAVFWSGKGAWLIAGYNTASPEEKSGILRDLLFRDRAKNKSYVVKRRRAGVKDAELEYECVEQAGDKSLLHIVLHTGRSHQIRVQFSSRKMPLVGDVKYGSIYKDCPISLWSHALSFRHPTCGKAMHFEHLPEAEYYWKEFEYIKGEA